MNITPTYVGRHGPVEIEDMISRTQLLSTCISKAEKDKRTAWRFQESDKDNILKCQQNQLL